MPNSAIVHAAVFTAGALLGGGIAAAVSRNQRPGQTTPIPGQVRTPAPVIDVDLTGRTMLSTVLRSDLPLVLKYGHPGMFYLDVGRRNLTRWDFSLGPISDVLVRKAYVAGYDRRLRHPSWVWNSSHPTLRFAYRPQFRQLSI